MAYINQDTYFNNLKSRKNGSGVTMCNLQQMQSVAEQEYIKLKDEYEELVNHKKLPVG